MKSRIILLTVILAALIFANTSMAEDSSLMITGEWEITITPGILRHPEGPEKIEHPVRLNIAPPTVIRYRHYSIIPAWDKDASPWAKGLRLDGVRTSETTAPDHLLPESLRVKREEGSETVFQRGVDYEIDERWGTIGRLPGSRIFDQVPVWLDYSVWMDRIDSIVVRKPEDRNEPQQVYVREGVSEVVTASAPKLEPGETVIANVWVRAGLTKLTEESVYIVRQLEYKQPQNRQTSARNTLPNAWSKLTSGETLKILAWGDSVTAGGEVSADKYRWQNQFVDMLSERFPNADIQLETVAWGGRNSQHFLNEPPGSEYNFQERVLDAKPDLIISEFVNDSYLTPEQVEERYSYLLSRFKESGAEWIILTPHFVWHQWMGASSPRFESDNRPYVAGLRQFAAKHNVALADASLRWEHLAKQGIPYETLLVNSLNHPDDHGHRLFALSLMELFR